MSQNTRTNYFLGLINSVLQSPENEGKLSAIGVTVVVAGQIITGTLVSEDEYFSHSITSPWKNSYESTVKKQRQEYLDLPDEDFNEDDFPDHLKQNFLFLTNAFYVIGDKTIPSGNTGVPIQVRLADVVAFNFGSISISNN